MRQLGLSSPGPALLQSQDTTASGLAGPGGFAWRYCASCRQLQPGRSCRSDPRSVALGREFLLNALARLKQGLKGLTHSGYSQTRNLWGGGNNLQRTLTTHLDKRVAGRLPARYVRRESANTFRSLGLCLWPGTKRKLHFGQVCFKFPALTKSLLASCLGIKPFLPTELSRLPSDTYCNLGYCLTHVEGSSFVRHQLLRLAWLLCRGLQGAFC